MKLAALAVALLLALVPSVALAHSNPESGQPPLNGAVSASPNGITLTFDTPVVPSQTVLHVLDDHGTTLDHAPTTIDASAKVASLATGPLGAGVYTVMWSNQSAEDGHENAGYYTTVIGQPAPDRQIAFTGGKTDSSTGNTTAELKNSDITLDVKTPGAGLGPKPLDVSLADTSGQPIDKAFVRFRIDFGDAALNIPEDYVVAQPTPGTSGHYSGLMPIGILGNWTLKFVISRDGKPDVNITAVVNATVVQSSAVPAASASQVSPSTPLAVATVAAGPPSASPSASTQPVASPQPGTTPTEPSGPPYAPISLSLIVIVVLIGVFWAVRRTAGTRK